MLSARTQALLQARIRGEQAPAPKQFAIPARGNDDPVRLSLMQERIWLYQQMHPSSAAYNIKADAVLSGHLDLAALETAFLELVRRHEALRTTVRLTNGIPLQHVEQAQLLRLEPVDLRSLPLEERNRELKARAAGEIGRVFDLDQRPPWRASLFRLDDAEHVLLITIHHIVCDGWSVNVLLNDLASLYNATTQGSVSSLPELRLRYSDYASWERDQVERAGFNAALKHWTKELAGAAPGLNFPLDPATSEASLRVEQKSFRLDRSTQRALWRLGKESGATLFNVLIAAFAVALEKYTGDRDLIIATPTSNRYRPEMQNVVGLFLNMLLFRIKPNSELTFRELLAEVRQTALRAYAHQEIPVELLEREVLPKAERSQIRAMFTLNNTPPPRAKVEGLKVKRKLFQSAGTPLDLMVLVQTNVNENWALVTFKYDSNRLSSSSVHRLATCFQRLLSQISERPDCPLSDISLLTVEEGSMREAPLGALSCVPSFVEFSRSEIEQSLTDRFASIVKDSPGALAIRDAVRCWTYRELDLDANGVSRIIASRLGTRFGFVALLFKPGGAMVAAMIGVLKSGKAYVPLDPAQPVRRLGSIVKDVGAEAILADESCLELARSLGTGLTIIDAREVLGADCPLDVARQPDSLAYVLYTSGTTGTPKGVAQNDRNVLHFIATYSNALQIDRTQKVSLLASYAFDASVMDIYGALLNGASLHILDMGSGGFESTRRWLCDQEITVWHCTPTVFRHVLSGSAERMASAIKIVVLGGEEAVGLDLELLRDRLPRDCLLVNGLGPTESTLALQYCVSSTAHPEAGRLPVGYPVEATKVVLLDSSGRENEFVGELAIGSKFVAIGYWRHAAMTAERFVPSPFGAGERLYRTGDLARWREDGALEYLGRIDRQIKIHGLRIELGEIEAALRQHPSVRQAAAAVREVGNGEKRLIAYLVEHEGTTIGKRTVQDHLRHRLPGYMVPWTLVVLRELPLTRNQKVDYRALPEPKDWAADPVVAPRSPTERLLAEIWAELLHRDGFGLDHHFFEVGGDSLLAMRLVGRIREAFQMELPLRTLFESPTLGELAKRIEAAQQAGGGPVRPPLVAIDRPKAVPVSFAQERLWLLQQIDRLGSTYNLTSIIRLVGTLDLGALEQSLATLVDRHEALRTRFALVDSEPVQIIDPAGSFALSIEDCSGLQTDERAAAVKARAHALARQPFDLAEGPLFRAQVIREDVRNHVVVIAVHHIISDGWSMQVLLREAGALYAAFSRGRPSPLPALPIQYADYALWQRHWLRGKVLEGQVDYWRKRLDGAPATLELPTDRARPNVQSFRGATVRFAVSRELTDQLNELARAEGVTLFMLLLAALNVVLSRWSGQRDIVVGTPIAGRTHRDVEPLIGLFVNMLALRVDLRGDPTFAELLARVKEASLGAYAHQDLPFEKLVAELQPVRDLSRQPLFQVLFALQNVPREKLQLEGLRARRIAENDPMAKLDVSLYLHETVEGIEGFLEYATDLFDARTIDRIASHYHVVLAAIVTAPKARLSELPVLTEQERQSAIVDWNDTRADYPQNKCLHQLFSEQASLTPDAVAVMFEGGQLSYAELDRRSNQLARYLHGRGVGSESIVGLCIDRSLEMVVGLLGILKSGGAYLPLDPNYPPNRLTYMVSDARIRMIVTQSALTGLFPELDTASFVALDTTQDEINAQSCEPLSNQAFPENIAYVIYTSGSTGRPKGVAIQHRAVINLLFALKRRIGMAQAEVLLAVTRLSFDMSVPEYYLPLTNGAAVALQSRKTASDGGLLSEALGQSNALMMQATPTSWRLLLESGWRPRAGFRIWCGGEMLPSDLAAELLATGVEVWNLYGPTETTVWSTVARLTTHECLSVGAPLANTKVFVLNDDFNPVPPGLAGEIFIGGDGLARGYLGRGGLTGERFVPSPFGDGDRLYRTGDIGRWRGTGELECLGRNDHQVKIRGYRIELGEVEAALRELGCVGQAVVVVREDEPGDKRLVAYIVSGGEPAPDSGWLRSVLKTRLPDYMVPSVYVVLRSLPLTPNGKIDRIALLGRDIAKAELAEYVGPRTPLEGALSAIWCDVLKVSRVSVCSNFFESGGHSLLAMRVVARINSAFNLDLSMRSIFEAQTISMLADHIANKRRTGRPTVPPIIAGQWRGNNPPLSFAQERLWLLSQINPDNPAYNLPLAFRLRFGIDPVILRASLTEVVRRHEIMRVRIRNVGGVPLQTIAPLEDVPIEVIDLADLPEAERDARAQQILSSEAQLTFDTAAGPLYRAALLVLRADHNVLLFTLHALICDAWSVDLLIGEIQEIYFALQKGEVPRLPPLPFQYTDFAYWQRAWIDSEAMRGQIEYWSRKLCSAPSSTDLPTDRDRPRRLSFRGDTCKTILSGELVERFRAVLNPRSATLFMGLLAAVKIALFRWTDQPDLVVGSVLGNRRHLESETLIGCFTNLVPLRTRLDRAQSFSSLLTSVRDTVLEAYENHDCPIEKIIEAANPVRRLNQNPLYNVGLLLRRSGDHARDNTLPVSRMVRPTRTAQLDLRFVAAEYPGGLQITCEYSTDLFVQATVTALLNLLTEVLTVVSRDPDASIAEIAIPEPLARQAVEARTKSAGGAADNESALTAMLSELEELSDGEAQQFLRIS